MMALSVRNPERTGTRRAVGGAKLDQATPTFATTTHTRPSYPHKPRPHLRGERPSMTLMLTYVVALTLMALSAALGVDATDGGMVDNSAPRFLEPIPNKTVVVGRDVILPCSVDNLKGFKVSFLTLPLFIILLNVSPVYSPFLRWPGCSSRETPQTLSCPCLTSSYFIILLNVSPVILPFSSRLAWCSVETADLLSFLPSSIIILLTYLLFYFSPSRRGLGALVETQTFLSFLTSSIYHPSQSISCLFSLPVAWAFVETQKLSVLSYLLYLFHPSSNRIFCLFLPFSSGPGCFVETQTFVSFLTSLLAIILLNVFFVLLLLT
ncbi:hypothetical protein C7M84_007237 [Penaeus vannamei]|uniref:Uncharacterized protein n=1 Tax=Penaeus vannamei TaxID=6689 RepID=A0A423TCU6_PENVA|nr:hypothetical protein C7M84_007237 [Penaeus vannamei]